jgi:hypothetical protein
MAKRPDGYKGVDLTSPINRVPPGRVAWAENVRAYLSGGFKLRNLLSNPIITIDSTVQSLARMNDTTPAGPPSGYVLISASESGHVFADASAVASGLTGNPVSIVPFRPNTSVRPWAYIGDDSPYPNVTVDSGFNCTGMIKVRSDGLSRKMGIQEPENAPTVTFPGGGTGPSQIFYYTTYFASETGAESNPSPVSIPGTNSQSNPSATVNAATGSVINPNITVNASQYEGNSNQIRTKGGVSPGTITDFIVAQGFGPTLAIPTNVTIDGITVDLNWLGQYSGTGVLSAVSLYYLGGPIGSPKFPAIQNQSFSTDTLLGGNNDTWGATLTPAIVNDPSFGFGVQITTQSSGGSDRSFVNFMKVIASYSTQSAQITPVPSPDPQVDKINFYRQGGGLANPTFVGQGPNSATVFNDTLSDLGASTNRELVYYNYEPVPSIDIPRKGVLNASGQVLTWVSGDHFNTRWLPGTIILLGSPSQVAYTAVRRPISSTSWDFTDNDPTVNTIPNGTNLTWNIAQPDLAAQPLAYMSGPTDNINYVFGVGDPNRPGTLYWSSGSNLDSWPDTNQMDVTDPSEVLVNIAMSAGYGVLFSIKRAWVIVPNFFNALATVTGTSGSTWTLQATGITRGLFIPRCLCVTGGGNIFFRVEDGVHISRAGSASISITDDDLYPLFPHENVGSGTSAPMPITRNGRTIYPPDDSQPQMQKFSNQGAYIYYDYMGTDGNPDTLVFDEAAGGWVLDLYDHPATIHAANAGESVQGTLVGCLDGSIRAMTTAGTETPTARLLTPAIGGSGWQTSYEWTVEYKSSAIITLTGIAADAGNGSYGPPAITLPSSGGAATKYTFKVGPNKFKWMWFNFVSSDPAMEIYLDGFIIQAKPWGSQDAFKPVAPFRSSGGHGAQG